MCVCVCVFWLGGENDLYRVSLYNVGKLKSITIDLHNNKHTYTVTNNEREKKERRH